jgi:hypothetical protein
MVEDVGIDLLNSGNDLAAALLYLHKMEGICRIVIYVPYSSVTDDDLEYIVFHFV